MKEDIQKEIDAGRFWKAKELLRSEIGQKEYDKQLFEDYAHALSLMKDDVNAGIYYFLSGKRTKQYQSKIDLFFKVKAKKKLGSLTSQFPQSAKYETIDEFEEPMKSELKTLGLINSPSGGANYTNNRQLITKQSAFDWGTVIIYFLIASLFVGAGTILYWVFQLIINIGS